MTDGASDSPPITVVVIDDHELLIDAVERSLRSHRSLQVIGRARDIAGGHAVVSELQPDIVVLDIRLPDGSGIDAITVLKQAAPDVEIVVLTGFADSASLARALEAGCAGFVSKGDRLDELITAIEAVADGQVRVPPELLHGLVGHLRPKGDRLGHDLTAREREILRVARCGSVHHRDGRRVGGQRAHGPQPCPQRAAEAERQLAPRGRRRGDARRTAHRRVTACRAWGHN
jgi:DNA-binding NarL/FixJ family response regulator